MTPAQQLGPYRLIERIGRGGMGEVWKARDTRLDREVAIKLSAEQFTDRFDREARAIAALNHPNICTLFDVGPNYLVMELIDGPTLADRIEEGPIPLEESLAIAKQIADALEAAHEKNIVHRDLKPGNIKIRPDGSVKVLDFGLAKADNAQTEISPDATTLLHSPTQVGVILGTAAYMAPEQARGKTVDKRADIWSFGVVLHEMVTGKRLFEGEDLTETLAAVVKTDPDLTPVPHKVRRLLAKCLQKDPKKRLRDIGDVWDYLDNDSPSQAVVAPEKQSRLWPALTAAFAIVAAALAFLHFREIPPQQPLTRLSVPLPDDALPGFLEISPDGTRLVIALQRQDQEKSLLYVRSFDSNELRPLAGTHSARAPFWSPDGQSIGFFLLGGNLKVIPANGGPARTLCNAASGTGAWNREGVILFSTGGRLWRTTAAGGACTALGTASDSVASPAFLPDGHHFFYTKTAPENMVGVYLTSLDDAKEGKLNGRRILTDWSGVVYAVPAPGTQRAHLIFVREHSLMAQPFDQKTMQTAGDAIVLSDRASFSFTPPQAAASASGGTLAWISDLVRTEVPTWFDRSGAEVGRIGSTREQMGLSVSPDGNFVSSGRMQAGGRRDWWLSDLRRNSESPLSSGDQTIGPPVWLPGSRTVIERVQSSAGIGLYELDVLSGQRRLLRQEAGDPWIPSDVSGDGRYLIFDRTDPKTQADIWYVRLEGEKIAGDPIRLVATPGIDSQGQLSPDGKWLAYFSGESGSQVFIRSFPEGETKWKVSGEFGEEPRWLPDEKELCFLGGPPTRSTSLLCATVEPDGHAGLRIGTPRKMFDFSTLGSTPQSNSWNWSPAPDGKRFLVNTIVRDAPTTVNVMQNWQAVLKK